MKRILVVDDDPEIRDLVAEILRAEDYTVDLAANGREALARVRAATPDAVILDLMMPVMTAWDFVDACRASSDLPTLPILALSATDALPDAAASLGVRAALAKPFEPDVLLAIVAQLTREPSPDLGGVSQQLMDWAHELSVSAQRRQQVFFTLGLAVQGRPDDEPLSAIRQQLQAVRDQVKAVVEQVLAAREQVEAITTSPNRAPR